MSANLAEVIAVYKGSDGEATKALYARLVALGLAGDVAMNLFRAQKCSERAKIYRGSNVRGRYRDQAYERKQWSMDNLCTALAAQSGYVWGWGVDDKQPVHKDVLYIDLPTGQVSFHSDQRGAGPDYPGVWDGAPGQSPSRIMRFAARLLDGTGGP